MITKEREFLSLSNDLLFKETLTHKDNRDKLKYFLSCFTDFSSEYLDNNIILEFIKNNKYLRHGTTNVSLSLCYDASCNQKEVK